MQQDDWHRCYKQGWQGIIVPEAFSHPAKFARGLIRTIYDHAFEKGWLKEGDTVVDPFGGVALGAWPALRLGLNWIGMELEQKFVDLGNQNISCWNEEFGVHLPTWGRAVLIQGDSRRLGEVVKEAVACICSPPFGEGETRDRSPVQEGEIADAITRAYTQDRQGATEGNLAHLRAERADLDACISSPPYATGCQHTGGDDTRPEHIQGGLYHGVGIDGVVSSPPYAGMAVEKNSPDIDWQKQYETYRVAGGGMGYDAFVEQQQRHFQGYGTSDGQLAAMTEGSIEAAISSPPYEGSMSSQGKGGIDWDKAGRPDRLQESEHRHAVQGDIPMAYSVDDENLGNREGETFWSAARTIVEQVYQVLRPGGHAIWVVKAFVRDKQRVDFPGQWRQLCESCGFVTLHEHRAWVVEEYGTQIDLFGGEHVNRKERKGFFRRLAEKKGSPRIDWEVVWCMQKPA